MRVIVANYRFWVAGGPEKYMFKFMQAAEERGIEVIPFSVSNPQNEKTTYSRYFAKPRSKALLYSDTPRTFRNLIGMTRAVIYNFDAEKRLRRLIRDTKPDVVYILHEINHLSPSIIRGAKKENIRVVHRISDFFMFCARYDFLCGDEICEDCLHGNYRTAILSRCVKNSFLGTIMRVVAMKLYRWINIFDNVDQFVTTCEFTKEKMIEGGIDENKIICIPTFIDIEHIKPCYENDKYFLFLGRMVHQKGIIYAIQAMERFKDSDFVLKITGMPTDSEEDIALIEYIKKHNLQDKIIFTGFKHGDSLNELISKAVCIVCPAIWYENMPNAVIEAYAYGKPVVASRLGSLEEIVVDGETGFLFEPKNVEELAELLGRFVDDKNLSKTLGKNSRLKCEMDYSKQLHMDKLISCFTV